MTTGLSEELEDLRRQLDRAGKTNAELAMLFDLARELAQSLEVVDIGNILSHTAIAFTGASLCSLWVTDHGPEPRIIAQAKGISLANAPSLSARLPSISRVFASGQRAISRPQEAGGESRAALPLHFGDSLLAVLEVQGFPFPEHMDEQVQALEQALPIAALSLKSALAAAKLREAFAEIERQNRLLEAQNEELEAQNTEIQTQSQSIQVQNEELAQLVEISRQQERRLQAIIDATADGLMVVDGEQRIVAVNPALEDMVGFAKDELIGQTCKYLLDARQSDGVFICDSACPFLHPEGQGPCSVDATITTRAGQQVWVSVAYGPIYDRQGRPVAVVHAIRDISARKEIEQLKDEFLSMTAHDLKTPLTSIKGYAQLLHLRAAKDQSRADDLPSLQAIDKQAGRMLDMINRLLDFARLHLGRLELHTERVDLVALIESLVEQAQMTTARHQLALKVEDRDLTGKWDRTYVEQVIGNLLGNAIKYSPEGGRIEILLRRSDGEALIAVRDQGIGIAKEDLGRLFERYFRSKEARGAAKGLGLGLFICKGLVEAHGGRIWAESQKGQGSSFYFTLPLRVDSPA